MSWPAEHVYPELEIPETGTEPYDVKTDFWTPDGHQRTVYLDAITHDRQLAYGTEKHTDRPVIVTWDAANEAWREST